MESKYPSIVLAYLSLANRRQVVTHVMLPCHDGDNLQKQSKSICPYNINICLIMTFSIKQLSLTRPCHLFT